MSNAHFDACDGRLVFPVWAAVAHFGGENDEDSVPLFVDDAIFVESSDCLANGDQEV
jgi:hypothetical protein